jgi:hypothetical protein
MHVKNKPGALVAMLIAQYLGGTNGASRALLPLRFAGVTAFRSGSSKAHDRFGRIPDPHHHQGKSMLSRLRNEREMAKIQAPHSIFQQPLCEVPPLMS